MGDIGGALDPVIKGDVTACRKTPMSNVLQASQMNINVICNLTNNCGGNSRLLFETELLVALDVDAAVNADRVRFRILLCLESVYSIQMRVLTGGVSDGFGLATIRCYDRWPTYCRK